MAQFPGDIPLHIERLARQIRRLDARHAALKARLDRARDEATADRLQREMANLKNQRVTPAAEVAEWIGTLPAERRSLVAGVLAIEGPARET